MSDRSLYIRLAVKDGETVRRALMQLGEDGARALARIENAAKPASKGLLALNEITGSARVRLEGYAGSLGGVGSALTRLGPAGLAAGAALGGIGVLLGQGIRELESAEHSFLRLEAVLKATGQASGLTGQELASLADAMEATTMATAEGVMDAASVLATFRSVSGDTFTRAIRAAQDMAAVFGQDLRASAVQLGKALEDPVEGISALRRVGVTFSASQRDLIASMVETGNVAGAQVLILEALERQVGGAGAAEASGLTGAAHHLKAAWSNLLEELARTTGVGEMAQVTLRGLANLVNGIRDSLKAPDTSQQVAGKVRELADAEQHLEELRSGKVFWDPEFGLRIEMATRAAEAKVASLRREIDDLIAKGHAEVEAFEAERGAAEAGRRQAESERNAEVLATRIKALEAEKAKAATDAAEKIAAVQAQLAKDIASAEHKIGLPGIDRQDVEREIQLLRDIAARKIDAIAKPERETRARIEEQARKILVDLQRELDSIGGNPREAAIGQAVSRLPKEASGTDRNEAARLAGLAHDTKAYEDELQRVTRAAQEEDRALRGATAALDIQANGLERTIAAYGQDKDAVDAVTQALAKEAEARRLNVDLASDQGQRWSAEYDRVQMLKNQIDDLADAEREAARDAQQFGDAFSSAMEDAVFEAGSAGEAVRKLGLEIAKVMARKAVFDPIGEGFGTWASKLFSSMSFGFGGGISDAGITPVPVAHAGWRVGDVPPASRRVPSSQFRDAPRFHDGWLGKDEFAAILGRDEGVFTPRQMENADRLLAAASGNRIVIQAPVSVTIQGGIAGGTLDPGVIERLGKVIEEKANAALLAAAERQLRPGGLLNRGRTY